MCYDRKALDSRKENKPTNSVMDMAATIGIELLTEEQYRDLQKLGEFEGCFSKIYSSYIGLVVFH